MPYSYEIKTGDGSTRSWTFSVPYIDVSHVKALKEADGTPVSITTVGTTVTLGGGETTPGVSVQVRIYRDTPKSPLVQFGTGTLNDADTHQLANLQLIYIMQEFSDREVPLAAAMAAATAAQAAATAAAAAAAEAAQAAADAEVAAAGVVMKPGMIVENANDTLPTGWLWCNGGAVSRTTYATLFAAIGTTYGAGNGTTTFNLPDKRDRVTVGKATMGSATDPARINNGSTTTLGDNGGGDSNTATTTVSGTTSGGLTVAAATDPIPLSGTANSGGGSGFNILLGGVSVNVSGAATGSLGVSASGTSGSFAIVQPYITSNFIIKT